MKELLLRLHQPGQYRVAVLQDGLVLTLRSLAEATEPVGNIYKGRVVNVEPSIQAAFVYFGEERNGFLHVSDVQPALSNFHNPALRGTDRRPAIQDIFARGQSVVVQVIRPGQGNRGPTLSTYLAVPGRFFVLMPALDRVGITRQLGAEERQQLRQHLQQFDLPDGLGLIARASAAGQPPKALQADIQYLSRLFGLVSARIAQAEAPALVYREGDALLRALHEVFTPDIDTIWTDEPAAFARAREIVGALWPDALARVRLFEGEGSLFARYDLDEGASPPALPAEPAPEPPGP